jgi:hypothetical protein
MITMASNKRKQQKPQPMSPGRTAQQPMAQSGADLMRAIGNLIPAAGPIIGGDATQQRSETAKRKGKGR